MVQQLSRSPLIDRESLAGLADLRMREARALHAAGFGVGATYLAGYAVECLLKAAICKTLDWDHLLGTFQTHDLEGLLLYSGLDRRLRENPNVLESFTRLKRHWSPELRYKSATTEDGLTADQFLQWVEDPRAGVATWLRNNIH